MASRPPNSIGHATEFEAKCASYNYCCAYCGIYRPYRLKNGVWVLGLTRDHVIPLSRGGANDIDNIVPCCARCNRLKADRTPEEWRAGIEPRRHPPMTQTFGDAVGTEALLALVEEAKNDPEFMSVVDSILVRDKEIFERLSDA